MWDGFIFSDPRGRQSSPVTSDAGAKARVWVQIFETLAASGVQFEVTKYGARWRHCPGSGVPGATIRLRLTGAKLLFRQQSTRSAGYAGYAASPRRVTCSSRRRKEGPWNDALSSIDVHEGQPLSAAFGSKCTLGPFSPKLVSLPNLPRARAAWTGSAGTRPSGSRHARHFNPAKKSGVATLRERLMPRRVDREENRDGTPLY